MFAKSIYHKKLIELQSTIDDCTTALKWTYVMTCQSQTVQDHFYYVCEFYNVPPGNYRLGYITSFSFSASCKIHQFTMTTICKIR